MVCRYDYKWWSQKLWKVITSVLKQIKRSIKNRKLKEPLKNGKLTNKGKLNHTLNYENLLQVFNNHASNLSKKKSCIQPFHPRPWHRQYDLYLHDLIYIKHFVIINFLFLLDVLDKNFRANSFKSIFRLGFTWFFCTCHMFGILEKKKDYI